MKAFHTHSLRLVAFSFAILFSSANAMDVANSDFKGFNLIESISEGLHKLEHTITTTLHNIFHGSDKPKPRFNFDVTLVGFVNFADGIGRHPILFKECLEKSKVKINFLSTRNVPEELEDAQLGLPRLDPAKIEDVGAVAILTDILADQTVRIYKKMPNSHIKVAYTMFESTEIPLGWATILNTKFDMVVVPDKFLVDVYRKYGVYKPIFVLPLPLQLNDFLKMDKNQRKHTPFVFGFSGGFWQRKNHIKVLEGFAKEFGNSKDVKLVLHGRFGEEEIIQNLRNKIAEYGLSNVELIVKPFEWNEYLNFFQSIDCGVCLSMGEGFSITPREFLACGKPCIVTNNTAQGTICNSGAVRVVESQISVPAFYDCHYEYSCIDEEPTDWIKRVLDINNYDEQGNIAESCAIELMLRSACVGQQFDCAVEDVQTAMRDIYQNYGSYKKKALEGRNWIKQYLSKNLSDKYENLVKPSKLILGDKNIIENEYLMTESKDLYDKYKEILEH